MKALAIILTLIASAASARDLDGKYADSPLHAWFDSLKSGNGLCCSVADGEQINDVDWDTGGPNGSYRVRLAGEWINVKDAAVVTVPNRFGPAVVWPLRYDGHVYDIRCFLPGAGT